MRSAAYARAAGFRAAAIGVSGLAYSVAFVLILRSAPGSARYASSLFLLIGGLLTTMVNPIWYVWLSRELVQGTPASDGTG